MVAAASLLLMAMLGAASAGKAGKPNVLFLLTVSAIPHHTTTTLPERAASLSLNTDGLPAKRRLGSRLEQPGGLGRRADVLLLLRGRGWHDHVWHARLLPRPAVLPDRRCCHRRHLTHLNRRSARRPTLGTGDLQDDQDIMLGSMDPDGPMQKVRSISHTVPSRSLVTHPC